MSETKEQWKARIGTGPAFGAGTMPTRSPEVQHEWDRMKRWEKEHDAARELRRNGAADDLDNLAEAPKRLKELGG